MAKITGFFIASETFAIQHSGGIKATLKEAK